MLIKSTILKLQKSFLYNFGVVDKIWLNSAAILVVKGVGDGALSSGPGLNDDLIQYVNKNKHKYLTVELVTRATFFIYGSQKLYVTNVLLRGRDVSFLDIPRVLYTSRTPILSNFD